MPPGVSQKQAMVPWNIALISLQYVEVLLLYGTVGDSV